MTDAVGSLGRAIVVVRGSSANLLNWSEPDEEESVGAVAADPAGVAMTTAPTAQEGGRGSKSPNQMLYHGSLSNRKQLSYHRALLKILLPSPSASGFWRFRRSSERETCEGVAAEQFRRGAAELNRHRS